MDIEEIQAETDTHDMIAVEGSVHISKPGEGDPALVISSRMGGGEYSIPEEAWREIREDFGLSPANIKA